MSIGGNPILTLQYLEPEMTLELNYVCFLSFRKAIFDTPDEDPNYNPLPEERPGGFAWGEGQRLGG